MTGIAFKTEELAAKSFAISTAVGAVDVLIDGLADPSISREAKIEAVRVYHDTAFGAGTMSALVNVVASLAKRKAELAEDATFNADEVVEGAYTDLETGIVQSDAKGG